MRPQPRKTRGEQNKGRDDPEGPVPPPPPGGGVPGTAEGFLALQEVYGARGRSGDRLGHETHLAMIAWTIMGGDEAAATERIISSLRRLDRKRAVPLAPGRSYNETITLFWIAVAKRRLPAVESEAERVAAARAFVRAFAGRGDLPYEYFSRPLVHSWRARSGWVEPDLKPLGDLCDSQCG